MDKYLKLAAGMTAEDAAKLFDTGVFNEICRAYMSMALEGRGHGSRGQGKGYGRAYGVP